MSTGAADPPGSQLQHEIAVLLAEVTGEDAAWLAGIDERTCLDGDLLLDSIELAALGQRLRQRHGDRVDLVGYVAGLDIDQIIALTVADVAAYVATTSERTASDRAAGGGRSADGDRTGGEHAAGGPGPGGQP